MASAYFGEIRDGDANEVFSALRRAGDRRHYQTGECICTQGEPCSGVHYVEKGLIKLTTVSRRGRVAVFGFLWNGDLFGETCLTGREHQQFSAEAIAPSCVLFVKTRAMQRLIRRDRSVATHFVKHLLDRNRRMEENLLDHIFNSSEQRLARTLLSLAKRGPERNKPAILERIDQDTLAAMIGTTRPRVNYFMNKFRKMGFIHYAEGSGVTVNPSLQNYLQNESTES